MKKRRHSTETIIAKASAMRRRGISRSAPKEICVQKQLNYLTQWTLAMERGKKAADARRKREAIRELVEAESCYRLYRAHGGREC